MAKLDSLHHDFSGWLTAILFTSVLLNMGAKARAWTPPDVTWTQSLHEEVKVATERFTGQHGDSPDWIAGHCGRSNRAIGASNCSRR